MRLTSCLCFLLILSLSWTIIQSTFDCSADEDCVENAHCTENNYCVCNEGFEGDGNTACTNVTECPGNNICHPLASLSCKCNAGYEGDGETCTNVDECALGTDNCDVNAECTDTVGSFNCTCNTGFEGDGVICQNVDECARGTDDCDAIAVCVDTFGSFRCEQGASTFSYLPYPLRWSAAKLLCDCFGHQAVVDTPEKQQELLEQIDIPDGKCSWIGASTWNSPDREFRWLQLPISYRTPATNGKSLRATFNNFVSGYPEQGLTEIQAVCVEQDGTWKAIAHNIKRSMICEFIECGPGKYKDKIPATNAYCQYYGGTDACVPCEDGTEKLGFGNSKDLCVPLP